jgi:hypothetical protein
MPPLAVLITSIGRPLPFGCDAARLPRYERGNWDARELVTKDLAGLRDF